MKLRVDLWLILPVTILIFLSLTTLLSINFSFFRNQLISLVIALAGFFVFSQVNKEFLKQCKLPIYITSLVLLGIILIIGIKSRGAIRWIDIAGVRLQFSEILKPFLAVSLASFISEYQHPTMKSFLLAIGFLLPIVFLIYLQPDLGNALI